MSTVQSESVSLAYKDGSSDKVYHAQLVAVINNKWVVNFQYGRRGNSLTSGTKTSSPVPFEQAKAIFDKLIQEKKTKGYSNGESGTPYQSSEQAGSVSGLAPQLSNPIEEAEVERYLKDDRWMMQEKEDGVRCIVRKIGSKVEGINRRGLVVNLPDPIVDTVKGLLSDITLDGERVGDVYGVFDILTLNGTDRRGDPAEKRFLGVQSIVQNKLSSTNVHTVAAAFTEAEKRQLYSALKKAKAEGVVFKRKDSKYVPGRPNSGGNHIKFKFCAMGTFQVCTINAKRSVALQAITFTGLKVAIGNVTIPPNKEIPAVGQLVEIRYLYCRKGGSLYQPFYLGVRDDKTEIDDYSTIKFKQGSEEDES
jgi:bifunctional non-homologous end joining protein LigD